MVRGGPFHKHDRGWGDGEYPASEKLEIIRLVEQSHLPVRRTLAQARYSCPARSIAGTSGSGPGVPRHWKIDRPGPDRVWNRIPEAMLANRSSNWPSTSPSCRRGSWRRASVIPGSTLCSEASVYRLLKAHDLIASPAFIVMKAADEFKGQDDGAQPAVADRLHLSEGHRLRLVLPVDHLDGFSRYIIAWKLCTTIKAEDVSDTLKLALQASGDRHGPLSFIDPGCSPLMAQATSRQTLPNGSTKGRRKTSAVHRIIR